MTGTEPIVDLIPRVPKTERQFIFFRRHIALPQQHGSWALWLGPFVVGTGVAGSFEPGLIWLGLSVLGAFLSIQPLAITIKVFSGRKGRGNLRPALFWLAVYTAAAAIGAAGLALAGHSQVLWLGLAALPVLAWHMRLIARREERGRWEAEILAAGMLALAAPAAFWVGGGDRLTGALLWLLCWLQSAAAIVHVYLRLIHRRLPAIPELRGRFRLAWRSLLFHGLNLVITAGLASAGLIPWLVCLPFSVLFLEVIRGGLLQPRAGVKPVAIGMHQTVMAAAFSGMLVASYLPGS